MSRKMIYICKKPNCIIRKLNCISRKSICICRKLNCMSRKPIFKNMNKDLCARNQSSFRFVKSKFVCMNSDFICEKSTRKWYRLYLDDMSILNISILCDIILKDEKDGGGERARNWGLRDIDRCLPLRWIYLN